MSQYPRRCASCDGRSSSEPVCRKCGGTQIEPSSWADDRLLAAYQRTSGEPGDVAADALVKEIQRRSLDV